ncbi:hypothetical protein ACFE04_002171 [Oxalis oulophora]
MTRKIMFYPCLRICNAPSVEELASTVPAGDVSEKAPKKNNKLHVEISTSQIDIKMPKGKIVRKIVGLELRHELVVDALLVIQFFAAFGKVLDLPNGHNESILQNCCAGTRWRNTEKISLGFLSLKAGTCKNYWLQALEMQAAKSRISPFDGFKNDPTGYEKLSACEKLKLLNFLCDEVLSTLSIKEIGKKNFLLKYKGITTARLSGFQLN